MKRKSRKLKRKSNIEQRHGDGADLGMKASLQPLQLAAIWQSTLLQNDSLRLLSTSLLEFWGYSQSQLVSQDPGSWNAFQVLLAKTQCSSFPNFVSVLPIVWRIPMLPIFYCMYSSHLSAAMDYLVCYTLDRIYLTVYKNLVLFRHPQMSDVNVHLCIFSAPWTALT